MIRTHASGHPRLRVSEVFGLRPLGPALRQCYAAVAGDGHAPPAQFGLSSLSIFKLRVSLPLWLGRLPEPRRAVVYLLPNRNPTPRHQGYSVKVTYARDFRGRRMSYDGHLGTDFAVPVGSEVCAAAPGIVRSVRNDMQRGGLKVCVDHGGALITTYNHLARALVSEGDMLARGDVLALSGMSSIDGILFFPWLAPHLHFNVLLNGVAVDPFARTGETSLWLDGNAPLPHQHPAEPMPEPGASEGDTHEIARPSSQWDRDAVERSIAQCLDPALAAKLKAIVDDDARAAQLVIERMFYPCSFAEHLPLSGEHERRPILSLPLSARAFDGVVFADELRSSKRA